MMDIGIDESFNRRMYGDTKESKKIFLEKHLMELVRHHYKNCTNYRDILDAEGYNINEDMPLESIPFIPVRLFKNFELSSIPQEEIYKVLTSSGTSSQVLSRIILSKKTATNQSKALVSIVNDFIGKNRLPMLIIDHPGVVKARDTFSARGAGILGFSIFGRDHSYALMDESMELNINLINSFLKKHKGEKILIFGFTFMIWKYLYQLAKKHSISFDLSGSVLMHGGGWKKLEDEAVDNAIFKSSLIDKFGIDSIHNFYGMVEQVGSIFMECSEGHLHTPIFADVLVRDPVDWSLLPKNSPGILQVVSVLQESYPGHSLLTEDRGEWIGEDNCPCGRKGKIFRVLGRIASAELRGCSDTHVKGIV